MPLPPASARPELARWRCPRWKFGTVSVRSTAALSVTVTIIGQSRCGGRGSSCGIIEQRSSSGVHETRPSTLWTVWPAYHPNRDGRPGRASAFAATSGRWPEQPVARPDLDAPDDLPAPHRQVERGGRDHLLDERPSRADDEPQRLRGDEGHRAAPVRELRLARRCSTCRSRRRRGSARCPRRAASAGRRCAACATGCRGSSRRSSPRPSAQPRPATSPPRRCGRSSRRSRPGTRRAGRSRCAASGRR